MFWLWKRYLQERSKLNKHECKGPDSIYLFNETEVKKIESSYERGFYGCVNKSSQIASKYMEYRSNRLKNIYTTPIVDTVVKEPLR